MASERCLFWFRVVIACFGIFAGFTAGPIFLVKYSNYTASSFAIVSGLLAVVVLLLHIANRRHLCESWPPALFLLLQIVGVIATVVGSVGFVAFIVWGIVIHEGISGDDLGENKWIGAVWFWMTLKWGFTLFYYSRVYSRGNLEQTGSGTSEKTETPSMV